MNRARIMLIDDDADECALVAEVVERAGFEVESFQDATIALERFAQASFDVALTDLNMPTMHGFSLCERLDRRSLYRKLEAWQTADATPGARTGITSRVNP